MEVVEGIDEIKGMKVILSSFYCVPFTKEKAKRSLYFFFISFMLFTIFMV